MKPYTLPASRRNKLLTVNGPTTRVFEGRRLHAGRVSFGYLTNHANPAPIPTLPADHIDTAPTPRLHRHRHCTDTNSDTAPTPTLQADTASLVLAAHGACLPRPSAGPSPARRTARRPLRAPHTAFGTQSTTLQRTRRSGPPMGRLTRLAPAHHACCATAARRTLRVCGAEGRTTRPPAGTSQTPPRQTPRRRAGMHRAAVAHLRHRRRPRRRRVHAAATAQRHCRAGRPSCCGCRRAYCHHATNTALPAPAGHKVRALPPCEAEARPAPLLGPGKPQRPLTRPWAAPAPLPQPRALQPRRACRGCAL
eukprot:355669-Chlamydomonas_euryale.AAC.1